MGTFRAGTFGLLALSVAVATTMAAGTARADAIADFYKGKTVTMIVGPAPGGDYDLAARLVGKYLVKHLPGEPGLLVQNMPGAGGVAAINHMFSVAAKDGSVIAVMQRAMPQLAYIGTQGVRFDPNKFTYLGTMSSYAGDAFPLFIRSERPVKSWQDITAQGGKKIVMGAVGTGSTNLTFPLIAKNALHLNIDVIRGYSGATAIYLAMERGEVDGQAAGFASIKAAQRAAYDAGKFRMLIQFGRTTRFPEMADVPTGQELAKNPQDKALIAFAEAPFFMAMPFIAPPDLPADRAKALQKAFDEAVADKGFLAEAEKFHLDASPKNGAEVAKLVADMAHTPKEVIARFKAISESR